MNNKNIIQKLYDTNNASREELLYLLENIDEESKKFLIEMAYKTRLKKSFKEIKKYGYQLI